MNPAKSSSRRLPVAPLLLAVAACAALLAGGTDAPAVGAPMSTSRTVDPPLPLGPTPDLDLLFTAQVAGWVEPCG